MTPKNEDPLLTTEEAAEYLNLSPRTLESTRRRGGGPPFVKLLSRAVRYRKSVLEAYLAERERRSTSDTGEPDRYRAEPPAARGRARRKKKSRAK